MVKLTGHQLRVLDAMVATTTAATRSEFIRGLVKAEYARLLRKGMVPVAREQEVP